MEATTTSKVTRHRNGDVIINGVKAGHVKRQLGRRKPRGSYTIEWAVTDLDDNYVTKLHSMRLAVQAVVSHASYTARRT